MSFQILRLPCEGKNLRMDVKLQLPASRTDKVKHSQVYNQSPVQSLSLT